ncbi:hypothetical protein EYF80_000760 [Liparis tanakae]|uniref:Uncharacterized protein n=1 Tax=Liparis tanakae TaxID=230148 RepID=A0A4Z2JHZ5_9TELE|nr:hypothetical protein EYF80_000760 [Liparis tanakae]
MAIVLSDRHAAQSHKSSLYSCHASSALSDDPVHQPLLQVWVVLLLDLLLHLSAQSIATSQVHMPIPYSDQSGQLVDEIIDSVDHELDVVPLRHAVLAMSPEDDIHIVAEDAFCNLHGDVPGDVLVFEAMNEPYRTGQLGEVWS